MGKQPDSSEKCDKPLTKVNEEKKKDWMGEKYNKFGVLSHAISATDKLIRLLILLVAVVLVIGLTVFVLINYSIPDALKITISGTTLRI